MIRAEFEKLATVVRPVLLRRAVALFHGNQQDAEDLVQETLSRAWDRIHTFRSDSSFPAFAGRILWYRFLDELRRRNRGILADDLRLIQPDPEETRWWEEITNAELERGVGQLPPEERRLFQMAHVDRLPQRTVAARTGMALATVNARLQAAGRKLVQILRRMKHVKEPPDGSAE